MSKTILSGLAAALVGGVLLSGAAIAAPASPAPLMSSADSVLQVRMSHHDRMMMRKHKRMMMMKKHKRMMMMKKRRHMM